MKIHIILLCAAVLLFSSCKPEGSPYTDTYSSIEYKNASSLWDIYVVNGANEGYSLERGKTLTLSSDMRGRGSIVRITPAYVKWQQNTDMYHIEFVDRDHYDITIENHTSTNIIVTEKNGYLYPAKIKIAADNKIYEFKADMEDFSSDAFPPEKLKVYTQEPVLLLVDSSGTITLSIRSSAGKFVYGIFADNPPPGWN